MTVDTFQLSGNAAESYEAQSVSSMFRPLTEAMLDEVVVSAEDTVLDVACGTGIVGRVITERIDQGRDITGVDLNGPMLKVARRLTRDDESRFRWYLADAGDMPFPDASFSIVFCQQGLQFMPDRDGVLREMRRVLQSGGRLALSIWSSVSPLFAALADSVRIRLGDGPAESCLAPYEFNDRAVITAMIGQAGFRDVQSKILSIERKMGVARKSIPMQIAANPVGREVEKVGPEMMDLVVADVISAMNLESGDLPFSFYQHTHLFTAVA